MVDSTAKAVIEDFNAERPKSGGAEATVDRKATMHADLDTLCTVVYCTADDLLPEKPGNARRQVTDAEIATLCVAQAITGIPSDRRFLAVARKHLAHLLPELPKQPGFHKRRACLGETIEWLIGVFAAQSPGFQDDLLLIDSTPVECARSVETTRRSVLADAADYDRCASHSSFFWALACTACSLPTARRGPSPCFSQAGRARGRDRALVIGDKGYAGRAFATAVDELDATIVRPARKNEPDNGIHLAPIRQRIGAIFWT